MISVCALRETNSTLKKQIFLTGIYLRMKNTFVAGFAAMLGKNTPVRWWKRHAGCCLSSGQDRRWRRITHDPPAPMAGKRIDRSSPPGADPESSFVKRGKVSGRGSNGRTIAGRLMAGPCWGGPPARRRGWMLARAFARPCSSPHRGTRVMNVCGGRSDIRMEGHDCARRSRTWRRSTPSPLPRATPCDLHRAGLIARPSSSVSPRCRPVPQSLFQPCRNR